MSVAKSIMQPQDVSGGATPQLPPWRALHPMGPTKFETLWASFFEGKYTPPMQFRDMGLQGFLEKAHEPGRSGPDITWGGSFAGKLGGK